MNDNHFSVIDTEAKAYILGWIASDVTVQENDSIVIEIHEKDIDILNDMAVTIADDLIVDHHVHRHRGILHICSQQIVSDVCRHLTIAPGEKTGVVQCPHFEHNVFWHFVRGVFDGDGYITDPHKNDNQYIKAGISNQSTALLERIQEVVNIPSYLSGEQLEYSHTNALDFLAKLYDNATISLSRKRSLYDIWKSWVPGIGGRGGSVLCGGIKCVRTRPDAVLPAKSHASDSGFDLTILEKIKQVGDVEFYTTGIKVRMPQGWYCQVYPRSSISKTGYMLANSVGVIDRGYLGEIVVALRRCDDSSNTLQLPMRIAQLVPVPAVHMDIQEVHELDETQRSTGGFGSTGD